MKRLMILPVLLFSLVFAQIPNWSEYHNVDYAGSLTTVDGDGGTVGYIKVIAQTDSQDVYLHFFDLPVSRAITVSDYSSTVSGTVVATTATDHDLGVAGTVATVTVAGTTNYNGAVSVTVIDGLKFYYTETYVADETGTFKTLIVQGTTETMFTMQVYDAPVTGGLTAGSGTDAQETELLPPSPGLSFTSDLQILATSTRNGGAGTILDAIDVFIMLK